MADLVTLDELKTFLGVSGSTEDALLQPLADAIEELLERACGRELTPFSAAQGDRLEVLDGTGTDRIFVDYPVESVTAIAIGTDPAAPTETLDPDDETVVEWIAGRTQIRRVDGKAWGCAGVPRAVRITYDAAEDLPATAALAVKRVVAAVYRQRGAEGVTGERTATYSSELARAAEGDPIWQLAVAGSRTVHV